MADGETAERGIRAVTAWLEERGVKHDILAHEVKYTAADEARAAGVPPAHAAKSVALRDKDGFRLAVVPASRRLDLERVRELLGGSPHLRLATEEEMAREFPAFDVGALPPFGPMLPAPEVVDVRLLYHDRILCGAGDHGHSILLDPRELVRVAEPQVADICERRPGLHDEDFHELPRL